MNFFVEGLQGSGKSTLVQRLSEKYPDYTAVREGDYSPVELAWCAYLSDKEFEKVLARYPDIRSEIVNKTHVEGELRVICYTQIITDIPDFHKDLERYEIYNGRMPYEKFKAVVFRRLSRWNGDKMIFECSLFQNIVEDMILFRKASDEEILKFYGLMAKALDGKDFKILYLASDDIKGNIDIIRKERSDDKGNELWFPLMLDYFDHSPYAVDKGISGEEELIKHFKHRQDLELRILREVFGGRYKILKSKEYSDLTGI